MERTNTSSGLLGTIVTWKVPTSVPFETLRKGLGEAGLDPDMAQELAPYYALCRALNDMKKGRVIRKLRREDNKIFFQLTREHLDPQEATYRREAQLSIDTNTGVIECLKPRIKQKAEDLLAEHQATRTASDVTYLLFRIYKIHEADLIAIREQGGAYFVPKDYAKLVRQTRALLDAIGGKLRTFDVRLGSDDTAESIAESMSDHFEGLVEQFKESCESITTETRTDVQTRRWETVAGLKQKMELYRGLLSGYADHIGDVIEDAEKELIHKLKS